MGLGIGIELGISAWGLGLRIGIRDWNFFFTFNTAIKLLNKSSKVSRKADKQRLLSHVCPGGIYCPVCNHCHNLPPTDLTAFVDVQAP